LTATASGKPRSIAANIAHKAAAETSVDVRRVFLGLAAGRAVLAGVALLLAPWLYREHAAVLVLLRPTKEIFLFAGFLVREGDVALPVVIVAALPLLLAGVWLFFGLGHAYQDELEDADLPGLAGRILPRERISKLRDALDDRGIRAVFLGRLAAFPSSLMAAAAGSSGVSWKKFVVADTAGALLSLAVLLSVGYALGEAYERAGVWVTVAGVIVLVVLAVVIGRALTSGGSSSRD
jgi:membrane protein DedA with SNARE-associated domain